MRKEQAFKNKKENNTYTKVIIVAAIDYRE